MAGCLSVCMIIWFFRHSRVGPMWTMPFALQAASYQYTTQFRFAQFSIFNSTGYIQGCPALIWATLPLLLSTSLLVRHNRYRLHCKPYLKFPARSCTNGAHTLRTFVIIAKLDASVCAHVFHIIIFSSTFSHTTPLLFPSLTCIPLIHCGINNSSSPAPFWEALYLTTRLKPWKRSLTPIWCTKWIFFSFFHCALRKFLWNELFQKVLVE